MHNDSEVTIILPGKVERTELPEAEARALYRFTLSQLRRTGTPNFRIELHVRHCVEERRVRFTEEAHREALAAVMEAAASNSRNTTDHHWSAMVALSLLDIRSGPSGTYGESLKTVIRAAEEECDYLADEMPDDAELWAEESERSKAHWALERAITVVATAAAG